MGDSDYFTTFMSILQDKPNRKGQKEKKYYEAKNNFYYLQKTDRPTVVKGNKILHCFLRLEKISRTPNTSLLLYELESIIFFGKVIYNPETDFISDSF